MHPIIETLTIYGGHPKVDKARLIKDTDRVYTEDTGFSGYEPCQKQISHIG
jgi:hypothetical protein